MEKKRLSIQVTEEMDQLLDDMANRSGLSKPELLRQAVALAKFAQDAKDDKMALGVTRDRTKLDRQVVGVLGLT